MSLTLISQPPLFELAENPIEYKFSTNNLYQSSGGYSKFRLTVSAIPNAQNLSIAFMWYGSDVLIDMLTANTADDSGYQVSIVTAYSDPGLWGENILMPELQANYYINRDWSIAVVTQNTTDCVLEFTCKHKGEVEMNFLTDVPSGISGLMWQYGAPDVLNEGFETYIEMYISKAPINNWQKITASQIHVDNTSTFPLSSILSADYYGSPLPDFGQVALKNISNAIIKYYVQYAEAYGNPKLIRKLSTSATRYALLGGFGKDYFATKSFNTDHISANKAFLHAPLQYTLHPTQPHFLNFLATQADSQFTVWAEITYTDETTETLALFNQVSTLATPTLWCIPAGYNIVSTVANVNKTIYSYNIYVQEYQDQTTYTQSIYHKIDHRPHQEENYFLYRNNFGVYEVMRTTGTVQEISKTEKSYAKKYLSADYAITDTASIDTTRLEQREWSVNSGHKSKDDMHHLTDMLNSRSVYWILDNYFMPVQIAAGEATLQATHSGRVNSATFKVLTDHPQKNLTNV